MSKLLINILLIIFLVSPHGHQLPVEAAQFDFFVLSLTWPQSYCELNLINTGKGPKSICIATVNLPERFTIHGLWPSLQNSSAVLQNCSTVPYLLANIDPATQLRAMKNWPDVKYYDPKKGETLIRYSSSFWGRQWVKHGHCSNLDLNGYMRLTLDRYDLLLPIINNAMKVCRSGGTVDVINFTTQLVSSQTTPNPRRPRLICQNINNQQFLSEIRFYYENSGTTLIDSPIPTNCDTTIPINFP